MTINSKEMFMAGIWDWGFLNECFAPTRIRVTDIDGFVERNGKFLLLETKALGAEIPVGQMILFRELVKMGTWVMVIWGYQKDPGHTLLLITPETERKIQWAEKEDIQRIVRSWFQWADLQRPNCPDVIRPFLDRPLDASEADQAAVYIRQFNLKVLWGLPGDGKYQISIRPKD